MRRLWIVFALTLLGCLPSRAQTFVQGTINASCSGTSCTATFASNITAGNLLVVIAESDSDLFAATPITDCASNTYISPSPLNVSAGNAGTGRFRGLYAKNISAGAGCKTVTMHYSASDFGNVSVVEYSALSTTAPFDVANVTLSTATLSCHSGSVTPTTTQSLVIAGCGQSGSNPVPGVTGWTIRASASTSSSFTWYDQNTTSTASTSFNSTASSGGNVDYVGIIMVFSVTGVGGGGATPVRHRSRII